MKKLIIIIFGVLLLFGCAHKPAIPNGKDPKQTSGKSTHRVYTNKNRPSMPNQRSKQVISKNTSSPEGIMSPTEIFERLSSAVFKIYTSTGYERFQGSGFFISEDGIAVSNYHVFQGTTIGYEDIILSDGSKYKVTKIYHKSQENDFIIFKVGVDRKVNSIKIASSIPKVGEKIYTIGSPRGLDNTFSSGEISQIRENGKILQISAPIDHGSSGGVLLNSRGEAIGITSGGIDDSGANLNYAWNISLIKPFIP